MRVVTLLSRIVSRLDLRRWPLRTREPLLPCMTVAEVLPRTSDVLASFPAMTGPRSPTFDSTYPVPLQIERDADPRRYLLSNRGQECRDRVTLSLLGAGVMPATAATREVSGCSAGADDAMRTTVGKFRLPNPRSILPTPESFLPVRLETSSSLHASFRRRIRIRSARIRVASAIGSGIPQR